MGGCCAKLVRLSFRDNDTPEERALKQTVTVPFLVVGLLCLAAVGQDGFGENTHTKNVIILDAFNAGATLSGGSLLVNSLASLMFGRMKHKDVLVAVVLASLGTIIADWGQAVLPTRSRVWPWLVIGTDVLLVINAADHWTFFIVAITCLWFHIVASEDIFRWGLYRVDGWSTPHPIRLQEYQDCADPPCPRPIAGGLIGLAGGVLMFVTDFHLTRGFAAEMRDQMITVETSVSVAEELSVYLSVYDTESASDLLCSERAAALPPRLHSAMDRLQRNLCQYRPFLPQSCLPNEDTDTDLSTSEENAPCVESSEPSERLTRPQSARSTSSARSGRVSVNPRAPTSVSRGSSHGSVTGSFSVHRRSSMIAQEAVQRVVATRTQESTLPPRLSAVAARSGGDKPKRARARTHAATAGPRASNASQLSKDSGGEGPPRLTQRKDQVLNSRKVTLVAANVRTYLGCAMRADSEQLAAFHEEVITRCTALAAQHKGLTDGISGDRFYASLNGARSCVTHRLAGVNLGFKISELRSAAAGFFDGAANGASGFTISSGVASGQLLCGNIGCDALKKFSFIGRVATWCFALERLATRWGAPVVANGNAQGDCKANYRWRFREAAVLVKHACPAGPAEPPTIIWELIEPTREEAADEWMYQLQRQEDGDLWGHYNHAKEALASGNRAAALRHFSSVAAQPQGGSEGGAPAAAGGSQASARPLAPGAADVAALEQQIAGPVPRCMQLHEVELALTSQQGPEVCLEVTGVPGDAPLMTPQAFSGDVHGDIVVENLS